MRTSTDKIGFSLQLAGIYIEQLRLVAGFCRQNYRLSVSQYELLAVLYGAKNGLLVGELADFLVLQPSTIWQMAPDLEDRQLINGLSDTGDRRKLRLILNDRGRALAREIHDDLYAYVYSIVHESLPNEEYARHMSATIASNLDKLRGHAAVIDSYDASCLGFKTEFLVFMRVIVDQWRACVRNVTSLSLNEFRTILVLSDSAAVRVQDIALSLLIPRSQASACKEKLCELGLAREEPNPFDGRSVLVSVTKKGRMTIDKTMPHLDDLTIPTHNLDTEGGNMVLAAWHPRMYYNLQNHYSTNT